MFDCVWAARTRLALFIADCFRTRLAVHFAVHAIGASSSRLASRKTVVGCTLCRCMSCTDDSRVRCELFRNCLATDPPPSRYDVLKMGRFVWKSFRKSEAPNRVLFLRNICIAGGIRADIRFKGVHDALSKLAGGSEEPPMASCNENYTESTTYASFTTVCCFCSEAVHPQPHILEQFNQCKTVSICVQKYLQERFHFNVACRAFKQAPPSPS